MIGRSKPISEVTRPLVIAALLLLVALLFRLVDIFVLRLDELLGEIILSKSLGLALVIGFALWVYHSTRPIGLHTDRLGFTVAACGLVTLAALAGGYAADFALLVSQGHHPRLLIAAVDPKAGVAGGLLFAGWLVFGNMINALMEEGLFRGALTRLFSSRMDLARANLLQAALFGLWHLPWAVKGFTTGQYASSGELWMGIVSNFLPQLIMGLVWGGYYLVTGNLWGAVVSHFLVNSTFNLAHIQTAGGLDEGMPVRIVVMMALTGLSVWLISVLYRNARERAASVANRGRPGVRPHTGV